MAKIDPNNSAVSAKELKQKADEQGIQYKKNASAAQMQEILNTNGLPEWLKDDKGTKVKEDKKIEKESKVDVNALLARLADLENLVKTTWDHNKIKEYEDAKEWAKWFSFTLKLFPTDDWNLPVVSWRTLKNYTARNKDDKDEQKIEIIYLDKWEEKKQKMDLVDFVRVLERSDPILAKSLNNLDWSEVYVDQKPSIDEDGVFYIIKPKKDIFNVTLSYNWEEITILSTYLNA